MLMTITRRSSVSAGGRFFVFLITKLVSEPLQSDIPPVPSRPNNFSLLSSTCILFTLVLDLSLRLYPVSGHIVMCSS